jgi:hypothetical protein
VVREREFLWDAGAPSEAPSAVLLMLDSPDQLGESGNAPRTKALGDKPD